MYILRFGRLVIILIYLVFYYFISSIIPYLWSNKHFISIVSGSGTLIIKLGQILSLRPDICSINLAIELTNLRRDVNPIQLDLFSLLPDEIRCKIIKIDEFPIACGSIAQVYSATLFMEGQNKEIVFKILKPGVLEQIKEDLFILRKIAKCIDYIRPTLKIETCLIKLSEYILKQTDLLLEANNLLTYRNKGFNTPTIYLDYCRKNILCMEYLNNTRIKKVEKYSLFINLCRQMLTYPCFLHLDLHPGNVIYHNKNIYLIDVGLAQHIEQEMHNFCISTIIAVLAKDYIKFGTLFLSIDSNSRYKNNIPKGWIEFIGSLFKEEVMTPTVISNIFINILGSCHKYNVYVDERMGSIVMALLIINGHYNELCLELGKKENFIEDILSSYLTEQK